MAQAAGSIGNRVPFSGQQKASPEWANWCFTLHGRRRHRQGRKAMDGSSAGVIEAYEPRLLRMGASFNIAKSKIACVSASIGIELDS
jgi:hypothetical protein